VRLTRAHRCARNDPTRRRQLARAGSSRKEAEAVFRSSTVAQRLAPVLLFIMLAALAGASRAEAAGHDRGAIRATPIGAPTWKPVDFHMLSAPIGTAASGYAEFGTTINAVLPAPNHEPHPQLGAGPGAQHPPRTYDRELREGVRAAGFRERDRFTLAEFSSGNGVIVAWMNVPWPGTRGLSPDFAFGPIIPNELFPIEFTGVAIHRGEVFSEATSFQVPPLDADLRPPFAVDGHSHFPIFFTDNLDFAIDPDVNPYGRYRWDLEMIDQSGAGWRIVARFAVRR
jgi:hypothetical protein